MGFGAIFLGIMFLYDFPITVARGSTYLALDIFPDFAAWILLYFGVKALAKKAEGLEKVRRMPLLMLPLSLLVLLKDTAFFSSFYTVTEQAVSQNIAGIAIDVCIRILEMGFLMVLFDASARFCRKKGEDRLSRSHGMTRRIALVEAVLFSVSRLGVLLPLQGELKNLFYVLSQLDSLFMVFLVWYGTIAMVRALIRVTD
jgi:hypothetical protein